MTIMARPHYGAYFITLIFLVTMGTQVCCCVFHHQEYTPCAIGSSTGASESCDCGPCPNISAVANGSESQTSQFKGTYLMGAQWGFSTLISPAVSSPQISRGNLFLQGQLPVNPLITSLRTIALLI
ncbi:hypothetical protein [Desulfomonile tiedjei]|uniref:Uncharacterized protein n=1 Tax=Desulfomonile tiedjei (strain ATCC 49306 / DSM 6799 / DCB-1) TaxID=706587 RepID=I4C5W4_DESTA|nr:hypothetical protein [Desulfomonile tiedjei]AFM24955.1 hypothetical protein Desti_2265 [Desulfomonile tiedjei DSM 6799]